MKSFALALVFIVLATSFSLKFGSVKADEDSWVPKAPMPQGGEVYGAAGVNGEVYAFGAHFYNGTTYYTSGKYDPSTNSWSAIAPMPTPRIEFATAVCEGKIYAIGGKRSRSEASLDAVEVYDPATNNWASAAPMPTARDLMHASVVNGKIYVISGHLSFREPHITVFSDANEVYDPQANTWATAANIPNHVADYASAALDNKIYIIGGSTVEPPPIGWRAVNTTQIYDPATDKWTLGAPIPKTVMDALAFATSGSKAPKRIYIFAGWDEIGHRDLNQVYDPATDEWSAGAKQSFYNYDEVAAATLNDVMYVVGGTFSEQPFIGVNYQYTPIAYGASDRNPPVIVVLSPENKTYSPGNISIKFTVDEPATWMGYRLDGQQITAIEGNTTLNGLAGGSHNITLYARDASENTGASETIDFTVTNEQSLFLTIAIAATSIASVAVVGLLVYLRKRAHKNRANLRQENPT